MKTNVKKTLLFYVTLFIVTFGVRDVNAQQAPAPKVFVLVHGAWHGGWCWQKVSAKLRKDGNIVYTPTLSGLGEHKHTLTKEVNLETHIEDIVNLIEMEDLHQVVLVGHSYAGLVIAGVADRIKERLSKLVFLDAMLVDNGQSGFSVSPKASLDAFNAGAKATNGLSIAPLSPEFFGVTNENDIKWVKERLTPQPYRTFSQVQVLKHPFGNHLSLSYIACNQPELPSLLGFAEHARKSKE